MHPPTSASNVENYTIGVFFFKWPSKYSLKASINILFVLMILFMIKEYYKRTKANRNINYFLNAKLKLSPNNIDKYKRPLIDMKRIKKKKIEKAWETNQRRLSSIHRQMNKCAQGNTDRCIVLNIFDCLLDMPRQRSINKRKQWICRYLH